MLSERLAISLSLRAATRSLVPENTKYVLNSSRTGQSEDLEKKAPYPRHAARIPHGLVDVEEGSASLLQIARAESTSTTHTEASGTSFTQLPRLTIFEVQIVPSLVVCC